VTCERLLNSRILKSDRLLAQDGSDVPAVATEDKPASNYVYVSVGAGIGFPGNLSATNQQPTVFGVALADLSPQPTSLLSQPTTNTTMSQSNGFAGELAAGYQFDQARAELAVGYGNFGISGGTNSRSPQEYVIDSARVSPQFSPRTLSGPYPFLNAGSLESSGRNSYISVLMNGYYDIATGSKWRPYVGAGVGYANVTVGDLYGYANDGLIIPGGSSGAFAYQGKLGLSYEVIPKGNAFLEAAYLRTAGFTIRGAKYDPLSVPRVVLGRRQGF
jgi:opacity protein-like surface antigen